jgi:hypothetical protein
VTSPGLSATRWLSFALATNPNVFVAHGKHPLDAITNGDFARERDAAHRDSLERGNDLRALYESESVEAVFAKYREFKPEASAWGCVHSYTVESLIGAVKSPATLASMKVVNLLRHPVNFIASHESLVRSAEAFPELYQHYTDRVFRQVLAAFPELALVACPDLKAFFTFAVSCFGVASQLKDLAYFPGFPCVRMESFTKDSSLLRNVCEDLTGLRYSPGRLEALVLAGAINSHRQSRSEADPVQIVATWANWKRDIAAVMISGAVRTQFEKQGYDLSMLESPPASQSEPRATRGGRAPNLVDTLKAIDPNHSWLEKLNGGATAVSRELETWNDGLRFVERKGRVSAVPESLGGPRGTSGESEHASLSAPTREELLITVHRRMKELSCLAEPGPRLVESGYRTFNLVSFAGKIYAVSQSLGALDVSKLRETEAKQLEGQSKLFVFASVREVKQHIDQLPDQTQPRLLEEGYRGFNLVSYGDRVFAISQILGPFDLKRTSPNDLRKVETCGYLFTCESAHEAKQRVDRARPAFLFS